MRLLFPVAMAFAATASAQPAARPHTLPASSSLISGSDCPNATSHMAGRGSAWQSDPLKPQKLAELPPADTYAAVDQLDERGCMVPVMYPDVRALRR